MWAAKLQLTSRLRGCLTRHILSRLRSDCTTALPPPMYRVASTQVHQQAATAEITKKAEHGGKPSPAQTETDSLDTATSLLDAHALLEQGRTVVLRQRDGHLLLLVRFVAAQDRLKTTCFVDACQLI